MHLADVNTEQPIQATITALDGKGGKYTTKLLILVKINRVPQELSAFPPSKVVKGQPFRLSLAEHFYDPDNDVLIYSQQGLPQGTGFIVSPDGVFSGVPTISDVIARQPLIVRIYVNDGKGGQARQIFILTVEDNKPPVGKKLQPRYAREGESYFDILQKYFYDPGTHQFFLLA